MAIKQTKGNHRKKRNTKRKKDFSAKLAGVLTVAAILIIAGVVLFLIREHREEELRAALLAQKQEPEPEEPYVEPEPEPYYPTEYFLTQEDGRKTSVMPGYTCCAGIDVSEIQGEIDWEQVAEDGIEFAIIRAGYRGYETGKLKEDSLFLYNLEQARAQGIHVGVYFYSQALTAEEAKEEADFVLTLLGDREIDLPIFCDWEYPFAEKARTLDAGGDVIVTSCNTFCDAIRAAGHPSGFYLNSYMLHHQLDAEQLKEYPVWMAQYNAVPTCAVCFYFWQYSCEGTVNGINGNVDMNLRLIPG